MKKPYVIVFALAVYAVAMAVYAYLKGSVTEKELMAYAPVMILVLVLLFVVNSKKEKYREERLKDMEKNDRTDI